MNLDIKRLLGEVSNTRLLEDEDYIMIDGVTYMFTEVESEPVEDEGKYKVGSNIYELVIYDKDLGSETGTGLFFKQSFTKYGDYWNGYEFEYEEVTQVIQKQKTITYWAELE